MVLKIFKSKNEEYFAWRNIFFRALLQSLPLQNVWMTHPLPTLQRGQHRPIMPHQAHPDNFTTHPLHCPRLVLSSAQVSLVQSSSWLFAKSLGDSCQRTDFISELLSACRQNMRSPNSLAACQRKSATTNIAKVNVHDFLSAIIYSHLDAQIALWRRFAGGVQ